MQKRILGNRLEVSQIGYGAMGLSHAYGPSLSEKEFQEVIYATLDAGSTFFDTAKSLWDAR